MVTPSTRLVLIRHGESTAQVDGILSGHDTCKGLSDLGRRQATALRDRLRASDELRDVSVVRTSILPRAIQTAEIISDGFGSTEIQQTCALCEIHPGEVEGMPWTEVLERIPPDGDIDDPFRHWLPGAESWADVVARVGTELTALADAHAGERIAVVAHGGPIGASFVALGDAPMRQVMTYTRAVVNTSITEWEYSSKGWQLVRFNDSLHLGPDSTV